MGISNHFYKISKFEPVESKFTSERVGFLSLSCGIEIESHKMIPEHGEMYYQHIVSVSALTERDDCGNGLLWRIDNNTPSADTLSIDVLNAIYHGIAKWPTCFSEADKNNLTIAQRCVLDATHLHSKLKDEYRYHDDYSTKDSSDRLSVEVTSTRLALSTVQTVTWTFEKVGESETTTRTLTVRRTTDKDIVILSLDQLEKKYREQLNELCK